MNGPGHKAHAIYLLIVWAPGCTKDIPERPSGCGSSVNDS